MTEISSNLTRLKQQISPDIKVVAVSKNQSVPEILEAYESGHRVFGENRVQELLSKKDLLPSDIQWHLVGHLQTNKIKFIVPFISLIHSVDSFRLLKAINEGGENEDRVIDCLLQFHIALEESKSGFTLGEVEDMLLSSDFESLGNIRICGVMGMATFTDDMFQVRSEFRDLAGIFKTLRENYFQDDPAFREISMGMSGDYEIAIEEGSTIIRIGSYIFGERE
jgi:pyridoxal phosphate enzyme (YggS family)